MKHVVGVLLAAGAGRRMGMPKALVAGQDGIAWVVSAARILRSGGCDSVTVVLGAEADRARALLAEAPVEIVEASDWAEGMGASLRAGLGTIGPGADAALIHLVDLPDVGPDVVRRLLTDAVPDALARATYAAGPGHPVLIGRNHWPALMAELSGDTGARDYLARHQVTDVDCSDLASGGDIDGPGPMLDE